MNRTVLALLTISLTATSAVAKVDGRLDVAEKSRGSERVVLGTVTDVTSEFGENDHGDRLILSRVTVRVDETMKGVHEGAVVVTLEGGTVGDLKLVVSDMPTLERGNRAVMFLTNSPAGEHKPYGRGSGVVEIGPDGNALESDLTVDGIRAAVKAAASKGNQ